MPLRFYTEDCFPSSWNTSFGSFFSYRDLVVMISGFVYQHTYTVVEFSGPPTVITDQEQSVLSFTTDPRAPCLGGAEARVHPHFSSQQT